MAGMGVDPDEPEAFASYCSKMHRKVEAQCTSSCVGKLGVDANEPEALAGRCSEMCWTMETSSAGTCMGEMVFASYGTRTTKKYGSKGG